MHYGHAGANLFTLPCFAFGAELNDPYSGAPNERILSATDMALLDMGAECVELLFDFSVPLSFVAGTFATAVISRALIQCLVPFLPTSVSFMKLFSMPKSKF